MLLDIDSFKQVNDTHGHAAGDEVLCEVARRILRAVRSSDMVGRYGGEEFLIVLPNCGSNAVRLCAERILGSMVDKPVIFDGASMTVTVSLGTTVVDPVLRAEKDAFAAANSALYFAKRTGRNRVSFKDLRSA